ncbi:DUF1835 domain-containing protein [Lysinibacillus fusiformis]|uniref:DUF1835 domain-containing protein n=1 Tax=Lysinibacillus fusiformis TaxID=28031 RepID=UPI00382FDAF0
MAILHITFSLATQGSMKHAIRQHLLQRNESVLSVHDDFSIGPLHSLEERIVWLNTHIIKDNEDQQLYVDTYESWKKKIAELTCDVDVWVWYSQNTHEQIGLRYVMSEFIHKCSMVYGIDATDGLKQIQPHLDIRHTGELSSDMLMKLRPYAKRFSVQECQQLAKEWEGLKEHSSHLRLWNEGIVHVEEDAMDAHIIAAVKNMHAQQKEEWLLLMPIISTISAALDDYMSDEFIMRRIMTMIEQGLFQIEGDLSDFHSCRVKYIDV